MSRDVVIKLTPAEAAERAAWMLKGEHLGDGRVSVPENNANEHTVDSVALMLNATWQEIEEEQSVDDNSEEESRHDANINTLQERVEALLIRLAVSNHRLEEAQRITQPIDEPTPAQKRFDDLVRSNITYFSNKDFAGINASNRTFKDCSFSHCDLRNANFEGARLSGCTFWEANLSGANFKNAQMPGTVLSSAVLSKVSFDGANLCVAQLDWTNLREAILCNTNLQKASLEHSNLSKADCSGADFTDANLSGAKLKRAVCIASRFTRADLTNADLGFANLAVAKFGRAQLGFANLQGSQGFERKDHKGAFYQLTKMPGFTTYSTRKPLIETLENLAILITHILGICVIAGAGFCVVYSFFPDEITSAVKQLQPTKPQKKARPLLKQKHQFKTFSEKQ
jgi:uncharacterized protein YjbI with pentapeptide repeats